MKALTFVKYASLFLLLCNIPAFALLYLGASYGSMASYLSSLLLLVYFLLAKQWHKPALPFIIFGLLFFSISSFNYTEPDTTNYFMKEFLRFMIVVICGVEVLYQSKTKDFFFIFLIGACSIIANAMVFPEANAAHNLILGRYSGFYLNPNYAGSACLVGFALSYSIKSKTWRIIGQFAFTFAGILTLSRTFVILWLLINFVAIVRSKKNLLVPLVGVFVLIFVFSFTNTKIFASNRFEALESFFGDGPVQTETLKEDSRTATWAKYYAMIIDKPIFGNGYLKLQKFTATLPGVHNTYLMVIGEGGIIPFSVLIGLYSYLLAACIRYFNSRPELLYITIIVMLSMLVGHTYFIIYNNVLLSIYVYLQVRLLKQSEKNEPSNTVLTK